MLLDLCHENNYINSEQTTEQLICTLWSRLLTFLRVDETYKNEDTIQKKTRNFSGLLSCRNSCHGVALQGDCFFQFSTPNFHNKPIFWASCNQFTSFQIYGDLKNWMGCWEEKIVVESQPNFHYRPTRDIMPKRVTKTNDGACLSGFAPIGNTAPKNYCSCCWRAVGTTTIWPSVDRIQDLPH